MNNHNETLWKYPPGMTLPDFIICGAMKSGTTTVHGILNRHPQIFIPDPEIHFFDIDDVLQHPDYFCFQGEWYWPDIANEKQ